jgi:hypothetical protein
VQCLEVRTFEEVNHFAAMSCRMWHRGLRRGIRRSLACRTFSSNSYAGIPLTEALPGFVMFVQLPESPSWEPPSVASSTAFQN